MAKDLVSTAIDKQEWLEPLADSVQSSVHEAFEAAGDAGSKAKDFLHGTWLGHPLHAVLTDIPIGAWTSAVVMDAMDQVTGRDEFGQAADTAVAIGLAGAVAAAAAGIADWSDTDGRAKKMGMAHGLMNIAGAGLFAASLVARRNGERSAGRGLSTLGFLVAMSSAYLGGKLVYEEQIGVDHTVGSEFPTEFTPVMNETDLADGEMKRAEVNGSRVLVARRDGQLFAIAEVCSHLGGPLAEGEFENCTVKCPWHGSTFSLKDGRVIHGPATHPQPCLDVRVENGRVGVKARSEGTREAG
jgi:nitrite reductase/ring-hydroxylating ferredoxin subunit/uncharacterized membrane protein